MPAMATGLGLDTRARPTIAAVHTGAPTTATARGAHSGSAIATRSRSPSALAAAWPSAVCWAGAEAQGLARWRVSAAPRSIPTNCADAIAVTNKQLLELMAYDQRRAPHNVSCEIKAATAPNV